MGFTKTFYRKILKSVTHTHTHTVVYRLYNAGYQDLFTPLFHKNNPGNWGI